MQFVIVSISLLAMPPPARVAVLPEMVQLISVRFLELKLSMPPPTSVMAALPVAALPEIVLSMNSTGPELAWFCIPPPIGAVFMKRVQPVSVTLSLLSLSMPPPPSMLAVLPEIVDSVAVKVPAFSTPPPVKVAELPLMLLLLSAPTFPHFRYLLLRRYYSEWPCSP